MSLLTEKTVGGSVLLHLIIIIILCGTDTKHTQRSSRLPKLMNEIIQFTDYLFICVKFTLALSQEFREAI